MGEKTVRSLKEFVEVLEKIDPNQEVFFRGENGKYNYRTPSIYRTYDGEVAIRSHEYYERLFAESSDINFNVLRPFERLTEVQHFGGLTRFIDITSNALVALFFATEKNDHDGYVYVYKSSDTKIDVGDTAYLKAAVSFIESHIVQNFLKHPDEETFQKLTKSIKEFDPQGNRVLDRLKDVQKTLKEAQIIIATKSNPRIIRQQGAFIIPAYEFGNDGESQTRFVGESIEKLALKDKDDDKALIIKIPKIENKKIRLSLSNVGINIGNIYPDIEHQSKVVERYLGELRVNPEVQLSSVTEFIKKGDDNLPNKAIITSENSVKQSDTDELIESLIKSPNFSTTHAVVRRLETYVSLFSYLQVEQVFKALESNEQVFWILEDDDVAMFFKSVLERFQQIVNKDVEKQQKWESTIKKIENAIEIVSARSK